MPQVIEVADRVEVLRLGRRVATFDRGESTIERLVTAMTSGSRESA
jgi:simple sugar transport system ATP-binding protein